MIAQANKTLASEGERNASYAKKIFLVLFCLSNLAMLFVLIKVVPTFADVFASFGAQLPWPTAIVVHLSHFFQGFSNPLGLLGVVVLSVLIVLPLWKLKDFGPVSAFIFFLLPLLFVVFAVIALFIPMFELGNISK